MRKAYKRIISTAMVLSIVIQGNTVFAKEISNNSNNESKKLVVVYERKDSKDYLDILINGKTNQKEIKDGKLCEVVDGIDIAVVDSNKSTNLKSDMTNPVSYTHLNCKLYQIQFPLLYRKPEDLYQLPLYNKDLFLFQKYLPF